jgi:hypothetical protein
MSKRWDKAAKENTIDGFVSYNNVWKLFEPGSLIIRKDQLDSELLLFLVNVKQPKALKLQRIKCNSITWRF